MTEDDHNGMQCSSSFLVHNLQLYTVRALYKVLVMIEWCIAIHVDIVTVAKHTFLIKDKKSCPLNDAQLSPNYCACPKSSD